MTTDPFDRRLADWLNQDATGRIPDHLSSVLDATTGTRQRRGLLDRGAWRWVRTSRSLAFAAIALLLLAAAVGLSVGSRALIATPEPTMPRGGDLVVTISGDLYLTNATGSSRRPVVVGPTFEYDVRFSSDWSHMAFTQQDEAGRKRILVAEADGSNARVVFDAHDAGAFPALDFAWAPDGRRIAILLRRVDQNIASLSRIDRGALSIVDVDDPQALQKVPLPNDVQFFTYMFGFQVAWRGPGEGELLLAGGDTKRGPAAIYGMRPDGSGFRNIGQYTEYLALSPDGTWLTYFEYLDRRPVRTAHTRLVDVTSGEDRRISSGRAGLDQELVFSPDGRTAIMVACPTINACDLVEVALDGTAIPRVVGAIGGGTPKERSFLYSPDGASIGVNSANQPSVVINLATGQQTVIADAVIAAWGPRLP